MLVSFANNQTMVAENSAPTIITTDPFRVPVGKLQAFYASMQTHRIFGMGGGSPNPQLVALVEISNDGEVFEPSGGSITVTVAGLQSLSGTLTSAFTRLKFTLSVNGQAGDWASAVFDFHMNIVDQ